MILDTHIVKISEDKKAIIGKAEILFPSLMNDE